MRDSLRHVVLYLVATTTVFTGGSVALYGAEEPSRILVNLNTPGPTAISSVLEFSPDGNYLVAAGLDKVLRIWNVMGVEESGSLPEPQKLHFFGYHGFSGILMSAAFSPDGEILAVGTNTGRCYLVDWKRQTLLAFLAIENTFQTIAFSPDGQTLATGHNGALTFWNLEEFQNLRRAGKLPSSVSEMDRLAKRLSTGSQTEKVHLEGAVYSLSFASPPGGVLRLASAAYDNQPIIWEEQRGVWTRISTFSDPGVLLIRAVYAADGRSLITAGLDQKIRLWNESGSSHQILAAPTSPGFGSVIYPPTIRLRTAETAVLAAWPTEMECTVIRMIDGEPIASFPLHNDSVTACAVNPKRELVATAGGKSHEIYLWNPQTGNRVAKIVSPGAKRYSVAFSSDGRSLAYGDEHIDSASLSAEDRETNQASWDHDSFEFSWGLLRAQNAVIRPLQDTFDLQTLQPGPPVAEGTRWHRAQLSRHSWEIDRYVSKDNVVDGINTLVILRNHKEAHRITMRDDTDYVNGATLVDLEDGSRVGVVIATREHLALYDVETKQYLRGFQGHVGDVIGVAVSPDQSLLASAGADQTIRLWSLKDVPAKPDSIEPLLTIFPTRNGQFVAWTQQGFYTASPGADSLFGWRVTHGMDQLADFYSAKSFQASLYRPELVKSILASHGRSLDISQHLTVEQLIANATPPEIRFRNPVEGATVSQSEIEIEVSVSHPKQAKIDSLEVAVNGESPRALEVRPKLEGQVFRQTVHLAHGQNTIGVRALMAGGVRSDPAELSVTCTANDAGKEDATRRLFVLAVGVSRHRSPALNLRYAAKDAADLVAALDGQKGRHFTAVETKLLVDKSATRADVLDGLKWLKSQNLRSQDYVLVFLSGHGALDDLGSYCFVTEDAQVENLNETGIRYGDLRQAISRLTGRRFLLLDTCHAAGAAGESSVSSEVRVAYNNVLRDAANDYSSGIVTVASCLPNELSYEDDAWANGAFTKSLVEAIAGKGDLNQNGVLTVSELETYISGRIESLTNGRQSSCVFKTNTVPSNLKLAMTND